MSHQLLLVTLTPEGDTSAEVRAQVASILAADPSFCEGGVPDNGYFFYQPLADYFLVGGAWSGYLTGEEYENNWLEDGRECDALPVTEALYERFLQVYEGHPAYDTEFVDLDYEAVNPSFVGRKWVVIVDFHQ